MGGAVVVLIDRANELLKGFEPKRWTRTADSTMAEWFHPFIGLDLYDDGEIVVIYEEGEKTHVHEMENDLEGAVALVKEKLEGLNG